MGSATAAGESPIDSALSVCILYLHLSPLARRVGLLVGIDFESKLPGAAAAIASRTCI
jgi:hypothetical protein